MQGTQVRIDDRELEAVLREALGERRHGVVAGVIGEGQINDARRLTWPDGTQRILRIAPSDAFAAAGPSWFTPYGLRREAAVIAAASDLAAFLPVTVSHDFERRVIDRDWVIQEVMPGQPLSIVDRGREFAERVDIWQQVGRFTRSLHDIHGPAFGPPAWGPQFDRWSGLLMWDAEGMREDAVRFGYDVQPFDRLIRLVAECRVLLDAVTRPSLIHSDLCRSHIFVAQDGERQRLTGVIDLEFGRYADPLSEALITGFEWGNGPVEMGDTFMQAYMPAGITESDRQRIRIYAALALGWFVPLLHMQHEPLDDLMQRLGAAIERAEVA